MRNLDLDHNKFDVLIPGSDQKCLECGYVTAQVIFIFQLF